MSFPRSPDTRPEVASVHREGCPSCPHPTLRSSGSAVQFAREGTAPIANIANIAKDLGISESCLRNWMAQADADENGGPRLERENERLRRGGVFRQENASTTGSPATPTIFLVRGRAGSATGSTRYGGTAGRQTS
jgi:hypothetical protein